VSRPLPLYPTHMLHKKLLGPRGGLDALGKKNVLNHLRLIYLLINLFIYLLTYLSILVL